jgi:hypothetical protein
MNFSPYAGRVLMRKIGQLLMFVKMKHNYFFTLGNKFQKGQILPRLFRQNLVNKSILLMTKLNISNIKVYYIFQFVP